MLKKMKVSIFLLLCSYPFAGFSTIWDTDLNKYGDTSLHYAANIIQGVPGDTQALYDLPRDYYPECHEGIKVTVMPFLSTYDNWNLSATPLIAVKFDRSEVDKLPDALVNNLGVVGDRANVDFFLEVQGYPPLLGRELFEPPGNYAHVLLQPHMWGHAMLPSAGGLTSAADIRIFKQTEFAEPFTFAMTTLAGDTSFVSHDKTLSGNTRFITELDHREGESPTTRTYISIVRIGTTTGTTTPPDIHYQPSGRIAITIHMLLSLHEEGIISRNIRNCGTLNQILHESGGAYSDAPGFDRLRMLLRNLRDCSPGSKVTWVFTP